MSSSSSPNRTGITSGTPENVAPEIADAEPPSDVPKSFTDAHKDRIKGLEDKRTDLHKDMKDLHDQMGDIRNFTMSAITALLAMMTVGVGLLNFMQFTPAIAVAYVVVLKVVIVIGFGLVVLSQNCRVHRIKHMMDDMSERRKVLLECGERLLDELEEVHDATNDTRAYDGLRTIETMTNSLRTYREDSLLHLHIPWLIFLIYLCAMLLWASKIITGSKNHS